MKENMKEKMYKDFRAVLDKYGHGHDTDGVSANLRAWERNKAPLIELLRRHPDWNEDEMAIVLSVTDKRDIDPDEVNEQSSMMSWLIGDPEKSREFGRALLAAHSDYAEKISSSHVVERLKEFGVKSSVGQKASRVVRAVCEKYGADSHPEYNYRYAKLADALYPTKTKRKAALSVHPCDFLGMSNGATKSKKHEREKRGGWKSCHRLDEGCHKAGTLSYMNDGETMLLYTLNSDIGDGFHRHPKIRRQAFHWAMGTLLQSRLYPSHEGKEAMEASEGYRSLVQSALAECLGMPNLWTLKRSQADVDYFVETRRKALHYRDYVYEKYSPNISLLKEVEREWLSIGHAAFCLKCGGALDDSGSLECEDCRQGGMAECSGCGTEWRNDDLYQIDDGRYCDNCWFTCDRCRERVAGDEHWANFNGTTVNVCQNCLSREFSNCESCNEYFADGEGTWESGDFYCDACHAERFAECASCRETVRRGYAAETDRGSMCDSCFDAYTDCPDCGGAIPHGEEAENGMCRPCFDKAYAACAKCGTATPRDGHDAARASTKPTPPAPNAGRQPRATDTSCAARASPRRATMRTKTTPRKRRN